MVMETRYQDFEHGITCIDADYLRPDFASAWLLVENGEAAIIDCGTNFSVPLIMRVLEEKGLPPSSVKWIMPTHVHLDHAGGAGKLMQACPEAKLLVHPRGARHLIDPARLEAGVRAVYGEQYDELYGELVPVPEDRVVVAEDGMIVHFGERPLTVMHTAGHAGHHYCVVDERSRGVFTGDTMGIAYPEFSVGGRPWVFPPTTPVQFDPDAWHVSIETLLFNEPKWFYLTHYGRVMNTEQYTDSLHEQIDELSDLAREHGTKLESEHVMAYLLGRARRHGVDLEEQEIRTLLKVDADLCAQGLKVWLDRQQR